VYAAANKDAGEIPNKRGSFGKYDFTIVRHCCTRARISRIFGYYIPMRDCVAAVATEKEGKREARELRNGAAGKTEKSNLRSRSPRAMLESVRGS